MQIVFGGLLAAIGAMLIGFAYHDTIKPAWQVVAGQMK